MSKLYSLALQGYFRLRASRPVWLLLNREGRAGYRRYPPKLDDFQKKIVRDLKLYGIATTTLDELFPEKNLLPALQLWTAEHRAGAEIATKKKFLHDIFNPSGPIDLQNPFYRLASSPRILEIANSYLGTLTRLKYVTLQVTTPVSEGMAAVQSQRWHRDPQEKRMCKVFIYVNDVDRTAGPFIYVPQSTVGNKWGYLFPQRPPLGNYPPEGEMEKLLKPEDFQVNTGRAGTVIFCDTAGLHRGGYATKKERIMATSFYAADTFPEKSWYAYPVGFETTLQSQDPIVRYALTK